jgi:hypothetical protein
MYPPWQKTNKLNVLTDLLNHNVQSCTIWILFLSPEIQRFAWLVHYFIMILAEIVKLKAEYVSLKANSVSRADLKGNSGQVFPRKRNHSYRWVIGLACVCVLEHAYANPFHYGEAKSRLWASRKVQSKVHHAEIPQKCTRKYFFSFSKDQKYFFPQKSHQHTKRSTQQNNSYGNTPTSTHQPTHNINTITNTSTRNHEHTSTSTQPSTQSTHQHINTSTQSATRVSTQSSAHEHNHQHVRAHSHQHIYTSTHQLHMPVGTETHNINTTHEHNSHQHDNTTTRQHVNTSTRQHNCQHNTRKTHQQTNTQCNVINTSAHQHINREQTNSWTQKSDANTRKVSDHGIGAKGVRLFSVFYSQ